MNWQNGITTANIPADSFKPIISGFDKITLTIGCRDSNTKVPGGIWNDKCAVAVDKVGIKTSYVPTFDVLTGQGFDWVSVNKTTAPPPKAVLFGQQNGINIYLARHQYYGYAYIGKFTDDFYYDDGGNIKGYTGEFDVLVC